MLVFTATCTLLKSNNKLLFSKFSVSLLHINPALQQIVKKTTTLREQIKITMNKTKLNIAYLNLYHLYSKVIKVNELLISTLKETHILGISETRLKDYMDNKQ